LQKLGIAGGSLSDYATSGIVVQLNSSASGHFVEIAFPLAQSNVCIMIASFLVMYMIAGVYK